VVKWLKCVAVRLNNGTPVLSLGSVNVSLADVASVGNIR